ncbi:MAG: 1-deoxy-D-xylulose-5-phosphate reductoisomerase [Rikenellaceae bacterium]
MTDNKNKKRVAILGSTGSIGSQTLEVVERYSDLFEVVTLTANKSWEKLVVQAIKFMPDSVVIADKSYYKNVCDALSDTYIKVYAGSESVEQIVENSDIDVVVSALVGFSGLFPTANALRHGKKVALANKESLVVAGEIVMGLSQKYNAPIIPVDSEHSAIFQSLVGEYSPIEKIILTASGGPLRTWSQSEIENASVNDVLAHPNWVMGQKITVDSATMMNKGFEVIEAKWLFDLKPEQIDVTIHPSSVVHSMVQFCDGAVKAQLGTPDMKLPIQYALTFPERLEMDIENRLDFSKIMNLSFSPPDKIRFPLLEVAYEAMRKGGNMPCIVNSANEVAVAAFLEGKINFGSIFRIIENCILTINYLSSPSLDDYLLCDREVRKYAAEIVKKL